MWSRRVFLIMSDGGYKIRNKKEIHFLSFAVVEWVDVFTRKEYREIFIESLKYCQEIKVCCCMRGAL